MRRIAIVFGFSEKCYELARQLIVSCCKAATQDMSLHFFAYECNYNIKNRTTYPFSDRIYLHKDLPSGLDIKQIPLIDMGSPLPDISVYHHFHTNYMNEYDYVLFCHDDVYLKDYPVFQNIIKIADMPTYDLIAELAVAGNLDLSIRFRPSFIFVRTDKFTGLSFVNEDNIFHPDINECPIRFDGGASLLASYYKKNKTRISMPYTKIPPHWYHHLRFDSDYGVEMYNIINPNAPQFNSLISKCKQYADYYTYG